jgi:steroid 5-alpha reductase family enzyme
MNVIRTLARVAHVAIMLFFGYILIALTSEYPHMATGWILLCVWVLAVFSGLYDFLESMRKGITGVN